MGRSRIAGGAHGRSGLRQVSGFGASPGKTPFRPWHAGALLLCTSLLLCTAGGGQARAAQPLVIGAKQFTESDVLAEIAKQALARAGYQSEVKHDLGATGIVWEALLGGSISLYPEYTGTISEELLKQKGISLDQMRQKLRALDIGMSAELGFNNTYALAVRRSTADRLHLRTISDLAQHTDLRVGISNEFFGRSDGWRPLVARYGLHMQQVTQLQHGLSYEALVNHQIDVTDAYSTDAKIARYNLVVLQDNLDFFPAYRAVYLYRLDTPAGARAALETIAGTLDDEKMRQLNAIAERTHSYTAAADSYFGKRFNTSWSRRARAVLPEVGLWTEQHLVLVGISLALAVLVSVPLGIVASRPGAASQLILGFAGMVQTIPSLALLALLVPLPLLGISPRTAIVALFLYSLLPIIRNTATGLQDVPPGIRESAEALGLEPRARLRKVYLPMASRSILAGIKTSAIINVGTATLAALIGAGGLGTPIVSGLQLNDNATILEGAIPAALLALLVQGAFDLLDRAVIPKGLQK